MPLDRFFAKCSPVRFVRDENGAVTVDWVVITAAIIGMTLLMLTSFGQAMLPTSTNLGTALRDLEFNGLHK
jgi:Flp pilus assembly pilin Flp